MTIRVAPCSLLCAVALALLAMGCAEGVQPAPSESESVDRAQAFFHSQGKTVLTLVGYSGSGYEDEAAMLTEAQKVLLRHDPAKTIVNIGVTPDGIGAVYALAKEMGFTTSGIVSTQARKYEVAASSHVDHVFFIEDDTWGGLVEGTGHLSPTSEAMVSVSDRFVGIGGGAVGRDELQEAKKRGKPVTFIPADMNHAKALAKAKKRGEPAPPDFRGAAHAALAPR